MSAAARESASVAARIVEALGVDLRGVEGRRGVRGVHRPGAPVGLERLVGASLHGQHVPEVVQGAVVVGPQLEGAPVARLRGREVAVPPGGPGRGELEEGVRGIATAQRGEFLRGGPGRPARSRPAGRRGTAAAPRAAGRPRWSSEPTAQGAATRMRQQAHEDARARRP